MEEDFKDGKLGLVSAANPNQVEEEDKVKVVVKDNDWGLSYGKKKKKVAQVQPTIAI